MEIHFNPHITSGSVKKTKGKDGKKKEKFVADAGEPVAPQETFSAGEAAPIASTNLFALQELPAQDVERQKARQHGNALLDQLERIRIALLTGRLPESALGRIQALMQQNFMAGLQDEAVREIINEIEVRAAVELAKLRRELG